MALLETPQRIEPALLEEFPVAISDLIAELTGKAAKLGGALHPLTAAALADLVRAMNTYYSNLIEGHNTRPRDIERALAADFDADGERRNLQREALAHMRVQRRIDALAAADELGEPAAADFLRDLHREFYAEAPAEMLRVDGAGRSVTMVPGEWRSRPEHDNAVGRHVPPSSARVPDFMAYFERRYRFENLGMAGRVFAMAAAHHRFSYIHPFPDGNGRVGRLMSHAMAHRAGIGAHGLWSISRGLARGLESRAEYRRMLDNADTPRQGDLDGRGNLSEKALIEFVLWFLRVCVNQIDFMAGLFDLEKLASRLARYVEISDALKPETALLLQEALMRGRIERGEAARILRLPERSARRILNDAIAEGLLASSTPKGALSLRFPVKSLDVMFPKLFPET